MRKWLALVLIEVLLAEIYFKYHGAINYPIIIP